MAARDSKLMSYAPEALSALSLLGQIALVWFCVVFALPRVVFEAQRGGSALPALLSGTIAGVVRLASVWWLIAALVVAGAAWLLRRTPPERRAAALRLGLAALLITGTLLAVVTVIATITGLAIVGAHP